MTSKYEDRFGPVGTEPSTERMPAAGESKSFKDFLRKNAELDAEDVRIIQGRVVRPYADNLRLNCTKGHGCLCDRCVTRRAANPVSNFGRTIG